MKLRINEIFKSLQGEAQFAGHPMLFVRLAGCNRQCSWCDTKYHTKINKELTPQELANEIIASKCKNVCFTGGEPLIQLPGILEVIQAVLEERGVNFHLESNGDFLTPTTLEALKMWFDYLVFSPKELKTAKRIHKLIGGMAGIEIKVVTDMKKEGVDMLKYATMLMPLTTYNEKKDKKIMQSVWEYCVKNNKILTPRLQYLVYGKKMGV